MAPLHHRWNTKVMGSSTESAASRSRRPLGTSTQGSVDLNYGAFQRVPLRDLQGTWKGLGFRALGFASWLHASPHLSLRGASCLKLEETTVAIGGRPVGFDESKPRAETCDDKRQRAPNPSLKLSFCLFVTQALVKSAAIPEALQSRREAW